MSQNAELATAAPTQDPAAEALRLMAHPVVSHAAAEFASAFEAGTRGFFDAAFAQCDHFIDIGAHVGLASLYCAAHLDRVDAFEPSPVNHALFAGNLALNPARGARITPHAAGLAATAGEAMLYAKAYGDSGTSLHRRVERGALVEGQPLALAPMRAAEPTLRALGLGPRSLLKIDIEGAEYEVVPAIAGLLAEARPLLHLSFHPFNLVAADAYATALLRLRAGLAMAEALAAYPHMYFYRQGRWLHVGPAERVAFLERYLLQPKALPHIATAQYGFIDAVGFAPAPLDALMG